ncbi:MAG: hypothetical protein CMI54_04615 [Parcubacteria group bacterium]|nr:hypothetical protein [Parcubacteria group bacterium]
MRILKPKGYYSERMISGTSKKEKLWVWENMEIRKGDTLKNGNLFMDVLDVTPEGLLINYRKSLSEDS